MYFLHFLKVLPDARKFVGALPPPFPLQFFSLSRSTFPSTGVKVRRRGSVAFFRQLLDHRAISKFTSIVVRVLPSLIVSKKTVLLYTCDATSVVSARKRN